MAEGDEDVRDISVKQRQDLPLIRWISVALSRLPVSGVHARADITTPFLLIKYLGISPW